jgi:hypothetical protein
VFAGLTVDNNSFVNRQWTSMLRTDCIGRFVPDIDMVKKEWSDEVNRVRDYRYCSLLSFCTLLLTPISRHIMHTILPLQ